MTADMRWLSNNLYNALTSKEGELRKILNIEVDVPNWEVDLIAQKISNYLDKVITEKEHNPTIEFGKV